MTTKLTPKQIELLKKLSLFGGSAPAHKLDTVEISNGTRLSRRGLTRWGEAGKNHFGWTTRGDLHITDAGREALEEAGE
jgi:hypothetical protein